MDRKDHWSWRYFTSGRVDRNLLHYHLEAEWETHVRDFPTFLGNTIAQCPVLEVKQELEKNRVEEATGKYTLGQPHPVLFLLIPRGLNMDLQRFEAVKLSPAAAAYANFLREVTLKAGWEKATAVTTLWLEGTPHDRSEFDSSVPPRPEPVLEEHPLAKHYGLPVECLTLVRAHRMIEGQHRKAAWSMVLDHVSEGSRPGVLKTMDQACRLWHGYRDEVAKLCGLTRG